MFRGRPPPRGYPPPFEGRGPALRPHPAPGYRDDQNRHRPPYHSDHRDHGHLDLYRHSPSHRRYPSPGAGSHRSGEFRCGGPPAERSPSHRGPAPQDHNLHITVGNELLGPAGPTPPRHHDRDYSPRHECEQGRSTGLSQVKRRGRSMSRSPDRSRAKSRGRSKSRPRGQSRSPDRSRAKSRGR
ncbi:early nodulin-75-like, partial [Nothobranchius furzeri]